MSPEMLKRARKVYTQTRIDRFILLERELVKRYEDMLVAISPSKSYREYAGEGVCPICEQASLYTRSCKSCPIFVFSGNICTEDKSYLNLGSILLREVTEKKAIEIIKVRAEYHKAIVGAFKELKELL
jgi:hypothetical protein